MSAVAEKLPKTMAAIMCHGPKDYRLEEVAVPERRPGEAPEADQHFNVQVYFHHVGADPKTDTLALGAKDGLERVSGH